MMFQCTQHGIVRREWNPVFGMNYSKELEYSTIFIFMCYIGTVNVDEHYP
jgi:hypothetical protein